MILWDGSRHAWLEKRGPELCLMGAVDDATGELLAGAHFVEQECAAGYLGVLKAIARDKGLPLSAYMDRHGSLKRNDNHHGSRFSCRGAGNVRSESLPMRIGVIGGGSFGTALARLLADNGHAVRMWCHNAEVARRTASLRENTDYLPGVRLPETVEVSHSMGDVVTEAELLVAVSPSHVFREVMKEAHRHVRGRPYVVSACKGIEADTHKRMSQILDDEFGSEFSDRIAVLSGPSFAAEIAVGKPTAVVVAARTAETAKTAQSIFQGRRFRVYPSTDIVGVELGASAKNVIAIAVGVGDGLDLGHSCRAAMITRGAAEIARLAIRLGGQFQTVAGLSGMGDLVLTCTADLSRNRTLGLRLGRGEKLPEILSGMRMVAEGVRNSISVCELARAAGVEVPIIEQTRMLLHEDKPALQVLDDLMSREAKSEFY